MQVVNVAIFEAARAPKRSICDKILEKRVKPYKRQAFDQLVARDAASWTHHASAQHTVILDQVTSNVAESTMHMVGAEVSDIHCAICEPRCSNSDFFVAQSPIQKIVLVVARVYTSH